MNKYIYVFDYQFNRIYEIVIDIDIYNKLAKDDIETYLYKYYNIKSSMISFMISDYKLEIQRIEKFR